MVPSRGAEIGEMTLLMSTIENWYGDNKSRELSQPLSQQTSMKLYELARKNKIGLLFLNGLKGRGMNNALSQCLIAETAAYKDLMNTVQRTASILESVGIKYAIIKSVMPFEAVPNDVDAIIFGHDDDYKRALSTLRENSFIPLGKPAPLEECLHDESRGSTHVDPSIKDPFDLDIYREIGASHVVYMNKHKLENYIIRTSIESGLYSFYTLSKPAEMALYIFHSIFPERIYTMLLHYYLLFTIRSMSASEIDDFLSICSVHRLKKAALNCLGITENIQDYFMGNSEKKLKEIRESLGSKRNLNVREVPFKYPLATILDTFWNKKSDFTFAKSIVKQVLHVVRSSELRRHVVAEYYHRKKRETY